MAQADNSSVSAVAEDWDQVLGVLVVSCVERLVQEAVSAIDGAPESWDGELRAVQAPLLAALSRLETLAKP